jgi:hypothetical protein
MECELSLMDAGDGEPIEGFKQKFIAHAVAIECYECKRLITAGTVHEVVTGECDGDEIEWHTCPDCFQIAEGIGDGARLYGMLWEDLEEVGGEDSGGSFEHFTSGCLAKVETASAKTYLRERFLQWKGLQRREPK